MSASEPLDRAEQYARVSNVPAATMWALIAIAQSLDSVQRTLVAMQGRPGQEGGDMPLGPGAKADPEVDETVEVEPVPAPALEEPELDDEPEDEWEDDE